MANTLFLRLEGPLQSWGERAHWSVRDTAPEPTKSGIVGLLACALGWSSDEELRRLAQEIRLGVRCDRPGTLLVDYHTVSGGVISAEGKIKINANTREPETVVSPHHYLSDASFLVAVHAAPEWIERLAAAVQSPRWPIYLGRRSCVPSRPPFDGVGDFASLEAALADPGHPLERPEHGQVRALVECGPGEGVRHRDEVLSRSARTFGPRYARSVSLRLQLQLQPEETDVPGTPTA